MKGELRGDMDLYIDGEVEGKIHMGKSAVTVGPNGHVSADIEAREIFVQGAVHGNLQGSDRVVLGGRAMLKGMLPHSVLLSKKGLPFGGASKLALVVVFGNQAHRPQGTRRKEPSRQ